MKIVTSGARYIDIDAYAGCIAYAELLRLQGQDAEAVCEAPWNESISVSMRALNAPLTTIYTPSSDDTFALIDISDPEHFETFVDLDRVHTVIDHHPDSQQYWEQRIGTNAHIEFIGAACTQVYEQWKDAKLLDNMSTTSAQLLAAGILDNTLNFGARITTERDKVAYEDLRKRAQLSDTWAAHYFAECQETIFANISSAITHDTKVLGFTSLPGTLAVGQLVVWDAQKVLQENESDIQRTLVTISPKWFCNIVNVGERKSYFVSEDPNIRAWLSILLDLQFEGSVARAERLWLRKEIIAADILATNRAQV